MMLCGSVSAVIGFTPRWVAISPQGLWALMSNLLLVTLEL